MNKIVFATNNAHKLQELRQMLGDRYEILSGLSSGDRVVIAGQSRLTDGTKVQLQEQQSAKK